MTTDKSESRSELGPPMTKGERDELSKLIRARARVAKAEVEERRAALEADVERQLAASYQASHAAWAEVTAVAQQAIAAADAEIAARCRALGIPEKLRPELQLGWYGRGENSSAARRAELRKVALTRLDAIAQKALTAIEREVVDTLTVLVSGALTSDAAKAALAALPTPETLMPVLDLSALDNWSDPALMRPGPLALGAAAGGYAAPLSIAASVLAEEEDT